MRQIDFNKYRTIFPRFIYKDYKYYFTNQHLYIEFEFELEASNKVDSVLFNPSLNLSIPENLYSQSLIAPELDAYVFNMGMVELISYWKAACPKELLVQANALDEKQIQFWKNIYWNGLGEFFYLNGIQTNENDFMKLRSISDKTWKLDTSIKSTKIMVPIGGGKDSAVSIELLKESGVGLIPFIINPRKASLDTVKQADVAGNQVLAYRKIDPKLIELNKKGYLNGHTPFSAMLAFTSLLQARLLNAKYIALSNESSANESSILDSHVNHQYSKTYEFESDFRQYYKSYIDSELEYFSFLRPLSELQIACFFSKFEAHHFSFRSCNVGSKMDTWCCNCPKCLFTYTILSPFIKEEKLIQMLGENLLNKPSLQKSMTELQGLSTTKPFECIGTVSEVNLALQKAIENNYSVSIAQLKALDSKTNNDFQAALNDWNNEHFLPEFLEQLLKLKLAQC
ncbi:MAG: hypothetical protein JW729_08505 [Bacteroidales bacterium]|nr:hypothetical protein [Bacteroidales bacterium]